MTMNWKAGGLLLGVVFFLAVMLVKPIGVSTQFVILDGIIADAVAPGLVTQTAEGFTSTNEYLAKSNGKYAKAVSNPLNYSFIFVLAMALGGFLSVRARGGLSIQEQSIPALWRANFGDIRRSDPTPRSLRVASADFDLPVVKYFMRKFLKNPSGGKTCVNQDTESDLWPRNSWPQTLHHQGIGNVLSCMIARGPILATCCL